MSTRPKLDETTRAHLLASSVPAVVSILWGKGLKNTFIADPRPVNPNATKFVGIAFTVRTIPVREDILELQNSGARPNLQNKAVADIASGEVLVVGMGGETDTSFMGDIMTTGMMVKGVSGVILDGSVSDAAAISTLDLPVFATGNAATPLTSHRMVVELNGDIECAGVAVFDGDVIMGDANGCVTIPSAIVKEIANLAQERERLESFVVGRVAAGAPLEGTYPPNKATLAEYAEWCAKNG
jgi:regulator of RNase E activity RraA